MNIDLDRYPELKDNLQNIFCMKKSLIDLARKLENELLIYETSNNHFKLCYKEEKLLDESNFDLY